jgi:predicted esterase
MVPFEPEVRPDLSGIPVFMAAGSRDQMISPENTQTLSEMLEGSGAEVELRWRDTGHALTYEEVGEAKEWLSKVLPRFGGV